MFSFNPKTSIRKYPTFCSRYNFFSANVSDLYTYFIIKTKNFELSYLYKKLSYTNTFGHQNVLVLKHFITYLSLKKL